MKFSDDRKNKHRKWHVTPEGKYCIDFDSRTINFYKNGQLIMEAKTLEIFQKTYEDAIQTHIYSLAGKTPEKKKKGFLSFLKPK
jgi:hypothetical protein